MGVGAVVDFEVIFRSSVFVDVLLGYSQPFLIMKIFCAEMNDAIISGSALN